MLSVIVPVYNVRPYLEACVESILNQTYRELEVILVDDGSTDGSQMICDDFAKKDCRVKVIHKENGGQSTARNAGLEIAAGEYVTFVDSDDSIEPGMYHEMLAQLEKENADVAACAFYECTERGKKPSGNSGEVLILSTEEIFLHKDQIRFLLWNKIYRRERVAELRFTSGWLYEDFHYNRQAFLRTDKMVYIDVPFYNYRLSRPGNTNSRFQPGRMRIFEGFDGLIRDLEVWGYKRAETDMMLYALEFYRRLYKEAWELGTDAQTRAIIYENFEKYYRTCKERNIDMKKGLYLFHFLPDFDSKRRIRKQQRQS